MFNVANRSFSNSNVLIIAELGSSHGGSLSKARELIDAACEAGADCIKTQIIIAREILHPLSGGVPLAQGNINLFDLFKGLERGVEFYAEIKSYAEKKGALFLASPFGMKSAEQLFSLAPDFIKIASPELNYVQLLEKAASFKRPVILSSGVSKLAGIETALSFFNFLPPSEICLLHCVTAYPAPESEYNLRVLSSLKSVFGVPVGLSDHSGKSLLVPLLALSRGAEVIEKHFCLRNGAGGVDDPIALEPQDFALMCRAIRESRGLGSAEIRRRASDLYGEAAVLAALGDGVKRLAPCERSNYGRTNRSIHAIRFIKAGEVLTEENTAVLRTEKLLSAGLAPAFYDDVLGCAATRDIADGAGLCWADLTTAAPAASGAVRREIKTPGKS